MRLPKLRSIVSFVGKAGVPILRLFGVKDKTGAMKAAKAAEIADQALPPEGDAKP